MASPACPKPPPLPGIHRPGQRPHHFSSTLFPQPDHPLPFSAVSHTLLIAPHSASATAPMVRTLFDDAVYDGLPAGAGAAGVPPPVAGLPSPAPHLGSADSSPISCFSPSSSELHVSSSSDDEEDDASSSSTSSRSIFGSRAEEGPLHSLASLCAALPIKRGLSRYFSGKSQSFSSLASVSSVTDLAKPESRYVKRRRTARLGSMVKHHSCPPRYPSAATGHSKRPATGNQYQTLKAGLCSECEPLEGPAKSFCLLEF